MNSPAMSVPAISAWSSARKLCTRTLPSRTPSTRPWIEVTELPWPAAKASKTDFATACWKSLWTSRSADVRYTWFSTVATTLPASTCTKPGTFTAPTPRSR